MDSVQEAVPASAAPVPTPPPALPAAHAADVAAVEQAVDCMDQPNIDYKSIGINELLFGINPTLQEDVNAVAPDVLASLINFQERNTVGHKPPPVTPNIPHELQPAASAPAVETLVAQQTSIRNQPTVIPAGSAPAINSNFTQPTYPIMAPTAPNTNTFNTPMMAPTTQPVAGRPMSAPPQATMHDQIAGAHWPSSVDGQCSQTSYTHPYSTTVQNGGKIYANSVGTGFSRSVADARYRPALTLSMTDPSVMAALASFKQESTIAAVAPISTLPSQNLIVPPMSTNQAIPGMVGMVPPEPATTPGYNTAHLVNMSAVPAASQMAVPQVPVQTRLSAGTIAPATSAQARSVAAQATPIVPQVRVTEATEGPSSAAEIFAKEEEERKIMRAERNRQSAAASRERKKHFMDELERRVEVLVKKNVQLQLKQISAFTARLKRERELQEENEKTKRKILELDMKAAKLDNELEKLGFGDSPYSTERRKVLKSLEKPKTYDHGVASWEKAAEEAIAREEEFNKLIEERKRKKESETSVK